jgi:hypothetical protein
MIPLAMGASVTRFPDNPFNSSDFSRGPASMAIYLARDIKPRYPPRSNGRCNSAATRGAHALKDSCRVFG